MSTIQERATAWLASEEKEYNEGLAIVRTISNAKSLINNLSKKENLTNRDKINYLISRYLNVKYVPLEGMQKAGPAKVDEQPESIAATGEPKGGKRAVNGEEEDPAFANLPAEVQGLITRKRELFNSRNELSQQITDLSNDVKEGDPLPPEVEELTKQALEIDEQIKAIDSQVNYFFQNGKLMEGIPGPIGNPGPESKTVKQGEMGGSAGTFEPEATSLEEVEKKINNMKSQVSKANKAARLQPDNLEKKDKVAKLEALLKDLIWQRDTLKQAASANK